MPKTKQGHGEPSAPIRLECVKDGRMPKPFRIDGCVIWDLRRLDAAFDALSEPVEANTFDGWDDFAQKASLAFLPLEPRSRYDPLHREAREIRLTSLRHHRDEPSCVPAQREMHDPTPPVL